MARRPPTRRKKKTRRPKKQPTPGWIWMLAGLGVGLSVSAAIYLYQNWPTSPGGESAAPAAVKRQKARSKAAPEEAPSSKFTFYDMLPNFEVVIPEEDEAIRPAPDPVDTPGIYVLQAGSFSSFTDADRAKAQLAMMGVSSRIQKVSIDDKVYHRVRVGPVDNLGELNALRTRLREAKVEVMVIRVGQ